MNLSNAKIIGSKQGLISVGFGVLIAQLIITFMLSFDEGIIDAFFWFIDIDFLLHIIIGVIIMFVCGHLYGKLAGKLILNRKFNYLLVGSLCGLAVILTTTFFASWTGFIQEGLDNIGTNDNPFFDYIFKPMYWVTLVGFIPAILVGFWFGHSIFKKGNKYQKERIANFDIIDQTEMLKLVHNYESTYLVKKETIQILMEDDFFGDPNCGLIDKQNKWAVVAGTHMTLWTPKGITKYETEIFKNIHSIRLTDENTIQILTDPWDRKSGIWELNLVNKELVKISNFKKYQNKEYTDKIIW